MMVPTRGEESRGRPGTSPRSTFSRISPQVLRSDDETRVIAINLPAGEHLQEHQVHERAWVVVAAGEVEVEQGGRTVVRRARLAGPLRARASGTRCGRPTDARLILLLSPWPGEGHPSRRNS